MNTSITSHNKIKTSQKFGFRLFHVSSLTPLLLLTALLAAENRGQATITNSTVTLSANELRDKLYDASTSSPLLQNPIQAAVLHLMDLATRLNPGVLSAPNALVVMQNVIAGMTNTLGSQPQMTMMDLTSVALPYFQTEFSNVLPATTVSTIQNGLAINVVAEQQGLYSALYSNITTALPAGSVFSGMENTASAIQALQRQSASEVATLALPEQIRTATDGAFRQAAAQLVAQITGITPEDSLTILVQNVPALQSNQFLRNLAQTAANTGQVTTDINSLIGAATSALSSLSLSTSNNIILLAQISVVQQNILGSQSNPAVLGNSLVLAQQIQSNYISSISIAQPTVNFLSTVITDFGGDPQLGQQVATVGSAAFKIAGAINKFANNEDVSDGILSLSSTIATGNLLGAVLGVFSLFGDSGPSPDQIILQQIQVLQQNIAQLSAQINTDFTQLDAQLNSRFDQVDSELTNILGQINNNMITINTDFSYVYNNLGQIRSSLLDLQGDIQRLESQTYTWLTAIDQENLYLLLHNSLGYEVNVGFPMAYVNGGSEGDFVSFEGQYWLWAAQNSLNGLYQPNSANFNIADLYTQFATDAAPEDHLSYVNQFIAYNLGIAKPFSGQLANPRVWSIAANGLAEMCVENPGYFRQYNIVNDLGSIIQLGNNLNTFLNNLVAFNTNTPNTNLWIAACNGYRNAVSDYTNAILNDFTLFAINNNFPAGFNPFTNQFLSLVTPSGGTIKDGYYPNASVADVTAMACSPTPDGMPVYFLDQNTLRMLDTNGVITTLAGTTNAGFSDGSPGLLNAPRGLTVGSNGNVYISDTGNYLIRVFGTNGSLTTLAGYPGQAGGLDGNGSGARFNSPQGLLLDRQGNLLVADTISHAIRKVTPGGVVTTLAGTPGQMGTRGGLTSEVAINGPAQFYSPSGIAIRTDGHVFVADSNNNLIRQLLPAGAFWVVNTIAGQLISGFTNGVGQAARFNYPQQIASDAIGNIYVADDLNHAIRKITLAGVVTTVAGGGGPGSSNGTGAAASFYHPSGIAVDGSGNLYVADTWNSTIRKITIMGTNWVVSTLAGQTGVLGAANGFGTNATFYWPEHLALDAATNLYVSDYGNGVIRKITPDGTVSYFAGSPGAYGVIDGVGTNAQMGWPMGIAVDSASNIYVSDVESSTIRKISPSAVVSTFAGLPWNSGTNDGNGSNARFNYPTGLAVDASGNLYVSDGHNNTVRRISPDRTVSTIAGVPGSLVGYSDGANGPIGQFWTPTGLAMDTNGLIYVTDPISRTIRTINTNGLVGTYPVPPTSLAFLLPQILTAPTAAPSCSAFAGEFMALAPTASGFHFLALKADGTVAAWGYNAQGQCNVPAGLSNVVAAATGNIHSLALKADGTVVAWGDNTYGQCNVPAGLGNVVAISAGLSESIALRSDGTVVAWGDNTYGQCNVPTGLSNVVAVMNGDHNTKALKADGTVTAWGYNANGECNVPAGLSNVVAVDDQVALRSDGTVVAWGDNTYGQLNVPAGNTNLVEVAFGNGYILVLSADGGVNAWGNNASGQCNVHGLSGSFAAVGASDDAVSLLLKGDGTLVELGDNTDGQCNVPAGLGNVVAVMNGFGNTVALKADGTLAAWGNNTFGQCNVPVPVLPQQLNDTLLVNADVQQFSGGLITPDGRVLVADKFGLRLFDNSLRVQKQAASYLMSDMNNASGGLHTAAQNLTAWHMLLQTLATYGLPTALNNNDALNSLLFGSNPLIDSASATTYLNTLVNAPNWEPLHVDAAAGLQTIALGQIDQLQALLLTAVTQAATNANPASLPMVTDTLNRLNLLLATHAGPIPPPALGQSLGSSNTLQVTLNGFPYCHYELETSSDVKSWSTNATVFRQSGGTNFSTAGTHSRFFRGFQTQ